MSPRLHAAPLLLLFALTAPAAADEPASKAKSPAPSGVEQIVEKCRPSVVVVTIRGREGKREGLGTGFVVSADGLIATNLHVIGEGRPIAVELADGKRHDVIAVHATDRARDLAIVRIDAKGLPALPLGDSDTLKDGQAIVGLGNPQGLKHSVVSGVVSGRREIEGRPMIQLAVPLEAGNSGGPMLDVQGRVQGIMTLKSLVTANLGFAVPVNALKPLLAKPNPVPMDRWLTIGALDPEEWKPLFGARWRQRAGRMQVEGLGNGFGGRALCLFQRKPPELPYEVAVAVKLDDERGAAGLVFHADAERHYGFYPTGGRLRLTRFDGPDVFSWKILKEVASPHYRPGEWNTLRVRLDKNGIRCYVNDQLVIESDDAEITSGLAGLAKFRDTKAEFKQFRVAKRIAPRAVSPEERKATLSQADHFKPNGPDNAAALSKLAKSPGSADVLRERARELDRQAAQLRDLAARVHQERVYQELLKVLDRPEGDIDLIHAALLLAKLDNEEVDVDAYRDEVDRMAKKLAASLPKEADEAKKLAALNKFLFEERGFHGSRSDYYNRSNSYLNEVIDDREGIPITLSVLYIEIARRLGLKVEGVGLPGHFVVRHVPKKGEGRLIDVYEGGAELPLEEAKKRTEARTEAPFRDEYLKPVAKRTIVARMLRNLLNVARQEQDTEAGLRYLDGIVLLEPDAGPERVMRAGLLYAKGMRREALADVDYLIEHPAEGVDRQQLLRLRRQMQREE